MNILKRCGVRGAGYPVIALAIAAAAPAQAQQTSLDPRWQPWLGCWEPVPPDGRDLPVEVARTCVIPATGVSAVEFLAVADGRVVSRERVEATAEQREISAQNCSGWERAAWSDEGLRLYRRSEQSCPDVPLRRVTSVTSIAQNGDWLDVQSVGAGRGSVVRVRRFREAPESAILPDEVRTALQDLMLAASAARAAASARLQLSDVIEAVANVDTAVVEAWLAETRQGFELDGRRLAQLARDGMTGGVLDMMVALSNPKVFAVSTARGAEIALRDSARAEGAALFPSIMNTASSYQPTRYSTGGCSRYGWDPYGLGYGWEYDNRYNYGTGCGYGLGYGNGYGYGYGWGWGGQPVIVVVGSVGAGGASTPRGRVINGRGYSSGKTDGASTNVARPTNTSISGSTRSDGGGGGGSAGSGGYSGGSGGGSGGSGGGSTTSSSEGRTAKPRP